jgi:hypothetical protein
MADYSLKQITKLKSGDFILSIDSYGNVESTEVVTLMHYGKDKSNKFFTYNSLKIYL